MAHEIMQASGASGGGRSRLTAQAEDKVDRALTSFYARRIEIQETVLGDIRNLAFKTFIDFHITCAGICGEQQASTGRCPS